MVSQTSLCTVFQPLPVPEQWLNATEVETIVKAYRLEVIRTKISEPASPMNSPDAVAERYRHLEKFDREHMIRLDLDNRNRLIGEETVSVGTADSAIISPREIFRGALLNGARKIILLHNHPSGDSSPSKEDIDVKRKLTEAGEMIDIPVMDFIIIGENGAYRSIQ